ncbi:MAG: hypothetical protein Q3972_09180 [Corynebacterium sp.]|nr:hypothetical protein [Corynebacterium sp.]
MAIPNEHYKLSPTPDPEVSPDAFADEYGHAEPTVPSRLIRKGPRHRLYEQERLAKEKLSQAEDTPASTYPQPDLQALVKKIKARENNRQSPKRKR